MTITRFGPAGNGESFAAKGYKKTTDVPQYLKEFGLTAFEYQCGHGLRISEPSVRELGRICKEEGIKLSLHAPYYISLSSIEEEKRQKSVDYILQSAQVADMMGADRIVVHSGSCSKISREEALALAADTLKNAWEALRENGLSHIHICPETMGKVNQLGTLEEVLELCGVSESFIPTIDFGHLNARTFGAVKTKEDFSNLLDILENKLGKDRAKVFHSHFSKIEYTVPGGEKRHLTFDDCEFGPDFENLAELIAKRGFTPTFICESAGTQAEDAAAMMKMYNSCL